MKIQGRAPTFEVSYITLADACNIGEASVQIVMIDSDGDRYSHGFTPDAARELAKALNDGADAAEEVDE